MAYSPYFPQSYQQYIPQQIQQPQQIQNSGFIPVPNEDFARSYPVAAGNSVTFKDENAPYVYTKTMGFSQLDRPIFEKYKLVRENADETPKEAVLEPNTLKDDMDTVKGEMDGVKGEIDAVRDDIKALWTEINAINDSIRKTATRKKEGA